MLYVEPLCDEEKECGGENHVDEAGKCEPVGKTLATVRTVLNAVQKPSDRRNDESRAKSEKLKFLPGGSGRKILGRSCRPVVWDEWQGRTSTGSMMGDKRLWEQCS
jgi:hypothetical protein